MSSNPTPTRTAETSDPPAPPPAGGVSVTDLPPEALSFATRLFNAARTGDCEIFEQVLAYNAGVKDLRNEKGDTLIMLAAYHGHAPLVRLLLSYNANPDILNDRQQSPLAGAIFKGEKDVVEALLAGGADPAVGEPSARDAVRIFRQEAVWGERLGMSTGDGAITGGAVGGRGQGQGEGKD